MSARAIDLDVTHDEYHADTTIVSNTGKECFRRSQPLYEALYVSRSMTFPPPTPALQFGIWGHVGILEPTDWESKYICGLRGIDRRTKAGKEAEEAFLAEAGDKIVVPFAEFQVVEKMRQACLDNELIANLLERAGEVEKAYKWCDTTGMWLKSKPDKTFSAAWSGWDVILDLKTCEDASPEAFANACRVHGYHRTAGFRLMGHEARTGNQARYLFAAVTKREPIEVGLYELQANEIDLGHKENRRLLDRMAKCYETGDWEPEWSRRISSLTYPAWAFTNSEAWEVE